jgi:cardiolipin synthase (CMP-forming)
VTLANRITLCRISLVPLFATLAWHYGSMAEQGHVQHAARGWALGTFLLIATTDALDGWVARHWNQRSRLGAVLDPLADKLLMLTALVLLSIGGWPDQLPLWLPGVVIARDVLCSLAAWLIHTVQGRVSIIPHWTGKVATVLQMLAIGWVMLGVSWLASRWIALPAALITVISGGVYLVEGIRQLTADRPPHAS